MVYYKCLYQGSSWNVKVEVKKGTLKKSLFVVSMIKDNKKLDRPKTCYNSVLERISTIVWIIIGNFSILIRKFLEDLFSKSRVTLDI